MYPANCSTTFSKRRKGYGIQCPARMQHDFAVQFLTADPSEFARHAGNGVIRRSDQNDRRCKEMTRQSSVRLARPDKPGRAPRTGLAPRDNRADLPALFAQSAAQSTADASRANYGQGLFHIMLG